MATVCWLNQLSSARENVVVAAIASSSAGSAAIRLNSATMRACSRAPATFSFQARHRPIICQAITATMAMTSSDVDDEGRQHHVVARHDRREPGQDEVGGKPRDHRQADDDEPDPEGAVAGAGKRRSVFQQRLQRRRRRCSDQPALGFAGRRLHSRSKATRELAQGYGKLVCGALQHSNDVVFAYARSLS